MDISDDRAGLKEVLRPTINFCIEVMRHALGVRYLLNYSERMKENFAFAVMMEARLAKESIETTQQILINALSDYAGEEVTIGMIEAKVMKAVFDEASKIVTKVIQEMEKDKG